MQLAAFLSALSALSAGEYSRKLTQSIYTEEETPIYLPQITQIYADKPQNSINLKQTVFLCEIMQLAAFLCVICAICGRINTQAYSINIHKRNPRSLPLISQIYADETQNNKTTITTLTSNNLSFSA